MNIENKRIEYDLAAYGSIGLESIFGALNQILPLEICIEKLTNGHQFLTEKSEIAIGKKKAKLTLFNPDVNWTF